MLDDMLYGRQGEPITLTDYAQRLNDDNYRVVAQEVVGSYLVSTVWLGVDHAWGQLGAPLIFETMVFHVDSSEGALLDDLDTRRYHTEAQALLGHQETVTIVRATAVSIEGLLAAEAAEEAERDATPRADP